jgi:hypothetical protein
MERETTIAGTGNNRAFNIKCVAKHVECIVGSNAKSIYSVIFAATVHTTLPIRTASQGVSFALYTLIKRI